MKEISKNRKTLYYIGQIITILGVLSFLSSFLLFFINMNNSLSPALMYSSMNGSFYSPFRSFYPAFIGFVLIIIGSKLKSIGARGLAGSGTILDPKQARVDLEPFTSATGGMINDILEEVDIPHNKDTNNTTIVKVRCSRCKELNNEDATYCKSCGSHM